jgi:hypothetical protein
MPRQSFDSFIKWTFLPLLFMTFLIVVLPVLGTYIIGSCIDATNTVPTILGYDDSPMTPRIQKEIYVYAFTHPGIVTIVIMIVIAIICVRLLVYCFQAGILEY